MLILVGLGENNFNQKTKQSVASNFFVSCTAGAENLPITNLSKFSNHMIFDALVWTAGLYQDKTTWRANKNSLKRAQFLKSRIKLQFSISQFFYGKSVNTATFDFRLWKNYAVPMFVRPWEHCAIVLLLQNLVYYFYRSMVLHCHCHYHIFLENIRQLLSFWYSQEK